MSSKLTPAILEVEEGELAVVGSQRKRSSNKSDDKKETSNAGVVHPTLRVHFLLQLPLRTVNWFVVELILPLENLHLPL